MTSVWNRLRSSKVAWTAMGGILVAIGSWMGGELSGERAFSAVFTGLLALFFRDTLAKQQNGGP